MNYKDLFQEIESGFHKILPEIEDYFNKYFQLKIGEKEVVCPYFINTARKRDLRALMGKGTPAEIELETRVWAQVKKLDLKKLNEQEIRNLMQSVGIGIDCSGLVVHTLANYFNNQYGINLYSKFIYSRKSIRAIIARKLRPVENLGANDMTSMQNTTEIKLNEVYPGDLIRGVGKQRNAYHVALVIETKRDSQNRLKELTYVNSHRGYEDGNGMRVGKMLVIDINKSFLEQNWTDVSEDGRNYFYEDLSAFPNDSGFRRLIFLN